VSIGEGGGGPAGAAKCVAAAGVQTHTSATACVALACGHA
jgi:hypothetical protein